MEAGLRGRSGSFGPVLCGPDRAERTAAKYAPLLLVLLTVLFVEITSLKAQPAVLGSLDFDLVATGLDFPVAITHAGDGTGRLFFTLQRGQIMLQQGSDLPGTPFLDIGSRVGCCGERGLLSVAFHPSFESNGFFFVNYTNSGGNTVVSRFQVSNNPNVADAASEQILLTVNQPFGNHNGGQLQFGPDGFLYIALGDGGSANDPGNRAQNLDTLVGKILRIDVDQGAPFSIPANNPFVAIPGARPEIWALGLRNPWRFSFDRQTGDMFIGDVGQDTVEEIDFQTASSAGGDNYGWRRMEGSRCFIPSSGCADPALTLPILEYPHVGAGCSGAVTGGYRYRGFQFPQLNGIYFYADSCTGRLYAAHESGGVWTAENPRQVGFAISSFGEDETGELYFTDYSGGAIYRITTDHPQPSLTSLLPSATVAGGEGFLLTVTGGNFVPGAQVRWNGAARATTFVDNNHLRASIAAADLANESVIQVSVFNPAPGGGLSGSAVFEVTATAPKSPLIFEGGVVESAGYNPGMGVAPGSIAAVFGANLSSDTEPATATPLPESLGGAALRFGTSIAIAPPIFFASPGQINIQIPWELNGSESVLWDIVGDQISELVTVSLSTFSPGIFTMDGSGSGQGAIVIVEAGGAVAAPLGAFSQPLPSRPVRRGESLSIFATGLGPVTNTPPTGALTPASPLAETMTAPQVTIGGATQTVTFHGLAPGSVALYQVNVEVVDNTPSGGQIAVSLAIGGKVSNTVTVAVE